MLSVSVGNGSVAKRVTDQVSSSAVCVSVRTFRGDSFARRFIPCPYGNKRTLRPAHRRSTAGQLRLNEESDARVDRRRSCAFECDSQVAGLRVALSLKASALIQRAAESLAFRDYLTQKIPTENLFSFSEESTLCCMHFDPLL